MVTGKKQFYFRGCGWSNRAVSWSKEDVLWITAINQLFEFMYGNDVQKYHFLKGKGTTVQDIDDPRLSFQYDHSMWEVNYECFLESVNSNCNNSAAKSLRPQLDQNCEEVPGAMTHDTSMATSSTDIPSNNSLPDMVSTQTPMELSLSGTASTLQSGTESSLLTTIDLTESTQCETSIESAQWLTTTSTLTRLEFSKVVVPRVSVATFHSSTITKVFGEYSQTDPLSLPERPPERVVEAAVKAFSVKEGEEKPTGVTISDLGTFSRNGVTVLKKFCEISSLRAHIQSEERWLEANPDGLSRADISAIKEVLWNQRGDKTVLRAGRKSIDVSSFSTLVEERYLDNFVIDVCISWFLQDCQSQIGSKALYLPSETHTWLSTNSRQFIEGKLQEVLATSKENEFELLLCPLNMDQKHWGIIVIDLLNSKLLFDDGYQLQPDPSVLLSIKYILDVFHELRPDAHCFSGLFWSSTDAFERFGMPSQISCAQTGQGMGSCGVGVILAARDFIFKGATKAAYQFGWDYSEMRHSRKQLMLQIIKWAST